MDVRYFDTPNARAGEYLTELITVHDGDVLCFLAGGSALEIVKYLHLNKNTKGRTIFCMGDERVSGESTENNYLQLMVTAPEFVASNQIVDTSVLPGENKNDFSQRIEQEIKKIISNLNNVKIIALLGMGADGHTASIFPMTKELFTETYERDSVYVPVHVDGLTIDSRASLTPKFILESVDCIIGYINGKTKADKFLQLVNAKIELNEMPAQIIKMHKDAVVFTDIST